MTAFINPRLYQEKNTELIERCKKGERQAQYDLYKHYSKAMLNVAMRILNHVGEAEDVLQESFIDAFAKIKDFRQESSIGIWLKQIVVNKSLNQLRQRKVELVDIESFKTTESDYELYQFSQETEENISYDIEKIKHAMAQLPEGYRVVFSLYLFEGYDHEEIGSILNISESTSRSQFMRAKQKLIQILQTR